MAPASRQNITMYNIYHVYYWAPVVLNELGTLGLRVQSDFQLSFWYKYTEKEMRREQKRVRGFVGGRFASVYNFVDTICAHLFVDTICASKPRPATLHNIILENFKPCEWMALLNIICHARAALVRRADLGLPPA